MTGIAAGIVAGAVIAGGATIYGANKAAGAAEDAGNAQLTAAREGIAAAKVTEDNSRKDRAEAYAAAKAAALPSPQEIAVTDKMIGRSEASLQQQLDQINKGLKVLDDVDPAVKEAGSQTLKLLQGQDAAVLAPIRDQRMKQRSDLEQRLASRFGPGFRTSAAGIMALNSFDTDTTSTLSNAQFQALSQVSSITGSLGSFATNARNSAASAIGNAYTSAQALDTAALNQIDSRKARDLQATNALIGSPVNYQAGATAQNTLTQVAGNPYAGGIAAGQTIANIGGQVGQAALSKYISSPSGSDFSVGSSSSSSGSNPYESYAPGTSNFGSYITNPAG